MFEVIIIGAGPAGLMAGIMSKKNTLIIEKNDTAGKKLLITGGGRCNVTNNKEKNDFLNQIDHNKKYLYSAINSFGPEEIIEFFKKQKVDLKEEEDGKMFPVSNKSYVIKEALLNAYRGKINYNEDVRSISKIDGYYIITTSKHEYKTQKLVIATGGSSYKITGSTGDNLKFAEMLNQPVTKIYPAEVGLRLKNPTNIPGQSINNVIVKAGKRKKEGNLIYTHTGLSGSSIMLISEYIFKENINEIEIDLLPQYKEQELISFLNDYDRNKEIHTFLEEYFTKKFSEYLLNFVGIEKNFKLKQLNHKEINKLVNTIKYLKYDVKTNENIDLAYVTAGGIDIKYINTKTFESTINKNLYFVGEALDIHGPIGGYNITLALSTGYCAGVDL